MLPHFSIRSAFDDEIYVIGYGTAIGIAHRRVWLKEKCTDDRLLLLLLL